VIDKAPQIVRQRIFLAEIDIDHRQHRPLAFVKARQEKRYDRVLDIVGIEIGGNGRAKTFDGGEELFGQRRLRGFAAAGVAAAMVAADAALPIMPNAAAPPFRTVRRSKAFRSIVFLLFRDDCRLSLRPKSVGYGISLVKRPRSACWDQQAIAQSTLPELSE
jgi:hypothetical protein